MRLKFFSSQYASAKLDSPQAANHILRGKSEVLHLKNGRTIELERIENKAQKPLCHNVCSPLLPYAVEIKPTASFCQSTTVLRT